MVRGKRYFAGSEAIALCTASASSRFSTTSDGSGPEIGHLKAVEANLAV